MREVCCLSGVGEGVLLACAEGWVIGRGASVHEMLSMVLYYGEEGTWKMIPSCLLERS